MTLALQVRTHVPLPAALFCQVPEIWPFHGPDSTAVIFKEICNQIQSPLHRMPALIKD